MVGFLTCSPAFATVCSARAPVLILHSPLHLLLDSTAAARNSGHRRAAVASAVMALNASMRIYLFGVLVRVLLSLTPLSTLHPDEWMQSAEVMATQLLPHLPHATTWDWQFTCYNQSQPAHLPYALRPTHSDEEWRRAMQRPFDAAAALSPPTWLHCPNDMQIQAPIRNTLFPCGSHTHTCSSSQKLSRGLALCCRLSLLSARFPLFSCCHPIQLAVEWSAISAVSLGVGADA